jgi:hypothetical protein
MSVEQVLLSIIVPIVLTFMGTSGVVMLVVKRILSNSEKRVSFMLDYFTKELKSEREASCKKDVIFSESLRSVTALASNHLTEFSDKICDRLDAITGYIKEEKDQ